MFPPLSPPFLLPLLQGLKARNFIHSKIEENIKKKVQESDQEWKPSDALQQLIDSSNKNKEPISMQVMRRSPAAMHVCTISSYEQLNVFVFAGHQAVCHRAAVWGA